jgi:NADH:ubiquinone oxidoreductase subunit 5 (subunit L)/multisubunit Na+/H+ antiporter MnhA subunit
MVFLAVILTLVIVGGLSVYSFTKAFSITFLGSARSKITPHEVPLIMKIPGFINVIGILLISLFSPWVVSRAAELSLLFTHLNAQPTLINTSLPAFTNISLIAALLFGVVATVFLIRKALQRNAPAYGPTWGCGYSAGDARHQYTATSYSHYLRELAGPTVATTDNYHSIQEAEIFPEPRIFKTETKDFIEEEIMIKPVHNLLKRMEGIGWAQTGKIGHYLVYPLFFLLIIVLLTRFGIL